MIYVQKLADLRKLADETPCDSHHWPTHFAGCVPFVEVEVPGKFRLTYRVEGVDQWGPIPKADAAINYGKRLAQASNALPLLLDDLGAMRKALTEVKAAISVAQCYCAEAHRPDYQCPRCAALSIISAALRGE